MKNNTNKERDSVNKYRTLCKMIKKNAEKINYLINREKT